MIEKWLCLCVFGAMVEFSAEEQLLDIYSPVSANASSWYKNSSQLEFPPQLAIQADTSDEGSTCFVSKKERNPWFKLDLKDTRAISNVRLVVREKPSDGLPEDFRLGSMDNLTVYVSNSSSLPESSTTRCGSPWRYAKSHGGKIILDCGRNLYGQFLHVTVPSSSETYLLICCIVLNHESNPRFPLNISMEQATVISNSSSSPQHTELTIDGNVSSCSSLTVPEGIIWLRLDIQSVHYISEVSIKFGEIKNGTVFVGRSLKDYGLHNTEFSKVSEVVWTKFVSSQPVLGQFIYIQGTKKRIDVCEIEAVYDHILNIYSPVQVSASDPINAASSIWAPIDGLEDTRTWISRSSSKPWWRLEFPTRTIVSKVAIYARKLEFEDLRRMNKFIVYVGDFPDGNGDKNAKCGKPWKTTETKNNYEPRPLQASVNCSKNLSGRYLYVSVADSGKARIYLGEISVYGCKAPRVQITTNMSQAILKYPESARLTCTIMPKACNVIKVTWTGPDGDVKKTEYFDAYSHSMASSLVVRGSSFGGLYTCRVFYEYPLGSVTKQYNVSVNVVKAAVTRLPAVLTVVVGNMATLSCTGKGYPQPTITWKKDNVTISQGVTDNTNESTTRFSQYLELDNVSLSDNGTVYSCEASQFNGIVISSTSVTLIAINITISCLSQHVVNFIGNETTLTCDIKGNGVEEIEWIANGEKISQNATYTNHSKHFNGGIKSHLTVRDLQLYHGSLLYQCTAIVHLSSFIHVEVSDILRIQILGSITKFNDMTYDIGETSFIPFSCVFTANPIPKATLQLEKKDVTEATLTSQNNYEYNISLPIQNYEVKLTGLYNCLVTFPGSPKTLNGTAQLQAFPMATITPKVAIDIEVPTTVNLTCFAVGYPQPDVTWIRLRKSKKVTISGMTSVSLYSFNRTTVSTLSLNKAYLSEAGEYLCQATNCPLATKTFVVANSSSTSVRVRANVTFHSSSTKATFEGSVNLFCNATGYPAPTIFWTLPDLNEGSELRESVSVSKGDVSSSSQLHLENVRTKSHAGNYKCNAENDVGSSESAVITLSFEPRVVDPSPSSNPVAIVMGKMQAVNCKIVSYPVLKSEDISWFKNGHEITNTVINVERIKTTSISVKYEIPVNDDTVCGNYSCYKRNSPSVAVYVISKVFLNASKDVIIEGDTLILECTAVGCANPTLSWLFSGLDSQSFELVQPARDMQVKIEEIRPKLSRMNIKNINQSRNGVYRCRSTNDAFLNQTAQSDKHVTVYYVSSFNVSSNVTAKEGNSIQLNCTANGNPLLSRVTWMKGLQESAIGGTEIRKDGKYVIKNDTTTVRLTVKETTTSDTGFYWCQFPGVGNPVTSSTIRVTVTGRPASIPVKDILVSTQARNVTLIWPDPFDGHNAILYYNISYRENSSFGVTNFIQVNDERKKNTTTFSIKELIPYTTYLFKVTPVNDHGAAKDSKEFQITTNVSAPSAPRNLTVVATSSTSLFASWTGPKNPNGPINVYNVYIQTESEVSEKRKRSLTQAKPAKNVSAKNTSITITKLKKFSLYYVSVTASNKVASGYLESPKSITVSVRTEEDAPSAPRNVSVKPVDDTRLEVMWSLPTPANGNIKFYQVFYEESAKFSVHNLTRNVTTSHSKRSAILTDLIAFTNYTVAVRAYTISFGNLSNTSDGQTEQGLPSSPQKLTVVGGDSSSLLVTWGFPAQPRGIILNYLVRVHGRKSYVDMEGKSNNYKINRSIIAEASNTNLRVENLWPGVTYSVTVAAMTVKGAGNRSKSVEATTEDDTPLKPVFGQQSSKTELTVTVTLIKPSNRNGDIQYVLLFVAELKATQNPEDIDFSSSPATPYDAKITAGDPYVAAQFNYSTFPSSFTLGDGNVSGQYHNVPLKPGTRYAYAIRSVSSNPQLFSTSNPILAETVQSVSSGTSNAAGAAGAVVAVILAILVVIFSSIIVRRRRVRKQEFLKSEKRGGLVEMTDLVKPSVSAVEEKIGGIAGSVVVLRISMTGQPEPAIQWKRNGSDLPGNEGRFKLTSDGFLQISDLREEDAGLYQCTVSNVAGSSHCQIKLNVDANVVTVSHTKDPVAVSDFEEHVKELCNKDKGFSEEFLALEEKISSNLTSAVAKLPRNKLKNRYGNIVPYDSNRVVLKELAEEFGSDYINASYVHGYDQRNGYIACQGPNDETVNDFWRMVWQENVRTIIMVTNIKEKGKFKCSQYWPELKKDNLFGTMTVKCREELSFSQCIVRTFLLMAR
jgi:hypothetical protein